MLTGFRKTFVRALLAGASIAVGGTAFLMTPDPTVGALLFAVGLFCVCVFGFSLFTGKVCHALDRPAEGTKAAARGARLDGEYLAALPVIWLGNLAGAVIMGLLESLTRFGPQMAERAAAVCAGKLGQTPLSAFLLAVFCNLLICVAVDGYREIPHAVGKYLAILFGVVVFIVCGFEHCVANMYYFTVGGAWSLKAVGYLLLMTAGNALGGVLIPLLRRLG